MHPWKGNYLLKKLAQAHSNKSNKPLEAYKCRDGEVGKYDNIMSAEEKLDQHNMHRTVIHA